MSKSKAKVQEIVEPTPEVVEHSPKFEDVKGFYDNGLWTKTMVYNAIGRWITKAEYEEIIGETI